MGETKRGEGRPRKDPALRKVGVGWKVPQEMLDAIRLEAQRSGITQAALVERAIRVELRERERWE